MVAIAGYVSGGARFETDADQGVAILSARSLMKGTASRSSEALAEELDRYGITLTPFADSDTMGFYVEALNEHLDRALDVFADVLVSPTFPAEEVDRERRILLSDLAQREDDTVSATLTRFRRKLYGDHPYGRDPLGTEETVQGLSREQLERWHRRFFVPGRLTLAAVGDVSPDTLVAGLNARLAALPAGAGERPERRVPRAEPGLYQLDRDRQQSVIVVGFPAPSMHADERYALLVLNGVLSGMGARLFTELRDKRHLCYFTSSGYSAHDEGGSFTAYLGTSPAQVPVALEALTSELRRARSEPPSDEELTRAINGITGSHLISLQRNGSQAARFARLEALGVSHERVLSFPEHVRKVTREQVQRVAEQVIDLDDAVTTVLAPGALDGATRVE